ESFVHPSSPSSIQSSSFDSTGAVESESGKENTVMVRTDDDSKRPNLSYNALIMMAIRDSREGKLSLSGIYEYITTHYSYYRHSTDKNWKNSIRHNLSLCKSFLRVPREFGDPGKGAYWTIDPNTDEELTLHSTTGKLRRRRAPVSLRSRPLDVYPSSPFLPHSSFPIQSMLSPLLHLQHIDPRLLAGLLR
ncbi:hypothetical protein PENTCL1PPCAC_23135, partial [Pristionchus entomophagus]